MSTPPERIRPQDPRRDEEQPQPVPPLRESWSDTTKLLTDQLLIALRPGTPFIDRYEAGLWVAYDLISRLGGLSDPGWLESVERRVDGIVPEGTVIAPESNQVLSFQVGTSTASIQRFPMGGSEKWLVDRADRLIALKALNQLLPVIRELVAEATKFGILEAKRTPPVMMGIPEEEEEPNAAGS
jgi:hypothetical protein